MSETPANLDARAVANAILLEAWNRGHEISNLKLQKLLFLCHSFYLIKTRHFSLVRGQFEAWQYGPVHREVYDAFKEHAEKPIRNLAESLNPITGEKKPLNIPDCQEIKDTILDVVRFYGGWSAGQLVELTHKKDGPWDYVVKSAAHEANMGLRISNEIIMDRFKYHWFGAKNRITAIEQEPSDEKQIIA